MTIQDWGAIGELVGGIAVVVTLIYLAAQIRHNTRAVRLSTGHAVTEDFRAVLTLLAEQEGMAEAIFKGINDPGISGPEKMRYWAFNSNLMYAFENAYIQTTQDALDPRHWSGMKRLVIDYTYTPGFQEFWPNRKHFFSEDFQNFMDSEILQANRTPDVPLPAEY